MGYSYVVSGIVSSQQDNWNELDLSDRRFRFVTKRLYLPVFFEALPLRFFLAPVNKYP
jgi:hypothetical protein